MTHGFDVDAKRASALPFVIAWAAMLVLSGVSLWSAYWGLGSWMPVIEFAIAALQAIAVFLLFMRLKGPPALKWVFAGGGFFWLLFLYGLSMTDYLTRRGLPWHGGGS